MAKTLVPLVDGVEEMEAVIIIDTLRRAQWEVMAVGMTGIDITASRGVRLRADAVWSSIIPDSFDVLILPGGREGTRALSGDPRIQNLIQRFVASRKWVAAICAAPLALQSAGVLNGRKATCHPGVRKELTVPQRLDDRVVIDNRIITSQGPGTAFEFALTLIRLLDGQASAQTVAAGLIL
jgi:4-methyl-5(b-hydroxyethyl)-thiazole monophosphate biosynthesis